MGDLRSIKWLRPLLVALFVSYYIGGTAFTHTHFYHTYFYQTQLITHSHPYWPNADGLPDHEHSKAALETIALLDHFIMEAYALPLFAVVWVLLLVLYYVCQERLLWRLTRRAVSRAPPCLVSF